MAIRNRVRLPGRSAGRRRAVSSGGSVHAPIVSDSFNRADGELDGSLTDGRGDPDWPGGAGFVWTNQQGSDWDIQSNHAKPTTLGSNSRGIATVDCGQLNVVLKANVTGVGAGPGFVLRYADSSNYVYCYITTTIATIRKRVGGGDITNLLNVNITPVAGAEFIVRAEGTLFSMFYNGQFIGSVTIADAGLQTSTKHGILALGAGGSYTVDNFAIWRPADYTRLVSFFALTELSVYRENTNNFLVRLPIPGEGNLNLVAEWRFQLIQTALHMDGLRIVDISGAQNPTTLTGSGTAWESVLMLGAQGDAQGLFELVGGLHGNQARTSVVVELDTVDISSLAAGSYASGDELVIVQEINMLYPVDDTTIAGAVTLTHTLNVNGLHTLVERAFNSNDNWEAFTYYGMMMPGANTILNTYQVEGFSPATVVGDGNFKQFGTEAEWAELSGSAHGYKLRMTLPTGAPSSAGWDDDAIKMGFQDRADGVIKDYAVAISTTFSERQAVEALSFTHEALYVVHKG